MVMMPAGIFQKVSIASSPIIAFSVELLRLGDECQSVPGGKDCFSRSFLFYTEL